MAAIRSQAQARGYFAWPYCCLPLLLLLLLAFPVRAQTIATEYFHAGFGHYFITTNPQEALALDTGQIAGWARTGESFAVDGAADVCRFFSAVFAPKSSHFYTPYAAECANLGFGSTWTFEGRVFRVDLPDADGTCRAATRALYRLYNDGRSGAPNHRYTVRADLAAAMRVQGWISEGTGPDAVFACVPDPTTPPPVIPADLTGSVQLSPNARLLTDAQSALLTSLSATQAVFAQSIGLVVGDVFIVPDRGGFRVLAAADAGRTLTVTAASIDDMFAELELEGTVPLTVPASVQESNEQKAYLTPKPKFYPTYLNGKWGLKAEFKLLASCNGPDFEFVDVKVAFYGRPAVKVSKRSGTYEVSGVRVVAESTLRLGCKIKNTRAPGDLDLPWVKVPVATNIPGVAFGLDFGGAIEWETDITPVVQLAYAKLDGTFDIHRSPVFDVSVNGSTLDKETILKQIAGTTGVSYTGKINPIFFGKVMLTVLTVDIVGLRIASGPVLEIKAVYADLQRKFCGKLKWHNEWQAIRRSFTPPYDLVETLLFQSDPEIPTGFDLDCTTPAPPPPPPPPTAIGPTGNWLFTRITCDMVPAGCGICPAPTLKITMIEAVGGATVAMRFPDFPGDPGHTITRQQEPVYQGCYEPISGFYACSVISFDLPQKRTATLGTALAFDACSISAGWQGAIQ